MPDYKTLYSPDGKHSQQVGNAVREKELRFAGWTDKKPTKTQAASKPQQTKTADAPKETRT
ncbi:hypothetical protein ABZ799_01310 [Nocardiopsis dassonvillei]|uniref:hypothetical protein n=1 Tax=Nocardiopsis dassonvillei TaxID=2014 RepID=UPI0033DB88E8